MYGDVLVLPDGLKKVQSDTNVDLVGVGGAVDSAGTLETAA